MTVISTLDLTDDNHAFIGFVAQVRADNGWLTLPKHVVGGPSDNAEDATAVYDRLIADDPTFAALPHRIVARFTLDLDVATSPAAQQAILAAPRANPSARATARAAQQA